MDLILHNGNFYTMDEDRPKTTAVAIANGLIQSVGSDDEILPLATEGTKIVDLEGKTAVPGFNDSHFHILYYAMRLNMADLSGASSICEIIEIYKKFIEDNNIPAGTPVFGAGWNQNIFEEKIEPAKHDLDKASTLHPIIAQRVCGHAYCLNSAALETYGIDKNAPNVDGGQIDRNDCGEPSGMLRGAATRLVYEGDALLVSADIEKLILKTLPNLAEMGITSIHSDDFNAKAPYGQVYDAYVNLANTGKLTVRVSEKCRQTKLSDYEEMLKLPKVDENIAPYFKLNSVKIMGDGGMGAKTAYLKEDYHDDPGNRGIPFHSKESLEKIVALAHGKDFPVVIHAIGDATIEWCMDVFKKVQRENPKPHLRHGIVHCCITDAPLLKAFKENNLLAYVQPIFINTAWNVAVSRVGPAKASSSYAFKTLNDLGVRIPLGTDCPVDTLNPFKNIYCAVARKSLAGQPADGFNPHEALSVYEAVRAYTVDSAYASYEEDVKGMIKKGMYADITVLTKNIFEVETEELLETEVAMTVFDGRVVFERAR